MTREDIEAAAEMANDGLDQEAIIGIIRSNPIRAVADYGLEIQTESGPCVIRRTPLAWVVT